MLIKKYENQTKIKNFHINIANVYIWYNVYKIIKNVCEELHCLKINLNIK